ncbi:hypothetical protein [Flagellimonas marinaquae]
MTIKQASVGEDFEDAWKGVLSIIEEKKNPIQFPSILEQMRAIWCFGKKRLKAIRQLILSKKSKENFMERLMKLMDNKDGCMQQLLEHFGLHIKAPIQKALTHKIRALEKAAGSDNFLDSE